jgi:hypothetical protein
MQRITGIASRGYVLCGMMPETLSEAGHFESCSEWIRRMRQKGNSGRRAAVTRRRSEK